MDVATFRRLCGIAYAKAGITLGPSKEALVAARIAKRLRALGLASEKEYVERLEGAGSEEELVQFLDVISTNHTSFFREPEHFELLRTLVADWQRDGIDRVRIWSAASSTGEEPYSIAFTVEGAVVGPMDWRILATDISTRVLAKAQSGEFSADRIESMTPGERRRFFTKAGRPDHLVVRDDIRRHITFRRLNLIEPPYPMKGPFDVIFCRNVMIYFDQLVRRRVIGAMEKLLRPGGYLLIGHAEALSGISIGLRMLRPSVFVKPEGPS